MSLYPSRTNYTKRKPLLAVLVTSIFLLADTSWCSGQSLVTTISGRAGEESKDGTNKFARLGWPSGVARDAAGNLYVADLLSSTILKLTLAGTNWVVTTIAGQPGQAGRRDGTNTSSQFNEPAGIAVDSATNLYVVDTQNQTIRKLTRAGSDWVVSTFAGMIGSFSPGSDGNLPFASFYFPQAIASDGGDNLYVIETDNIIRKISLSEARVTTIAGNGGTTGDPGSGAGSSDGVGTAARFRSPGGVAVYNVTNVFVSDTGNHTIRKINLNGLVWSTSTIAGVPGLPGASDGTNSDALFNRPGPLTVEPDGSVYVADGGNHTVRRMILSETNWVVTTVAGSAGLAGSADGSNAQARFNNPQGLATGSAGTIFVSDYYNGTIRVLEQIGGDPIVRTIVGRSDALRADGTNSFGRLCRPSKLALDPDGNVYIADTLNHAVRRLTHVGSDWVLATVAGQLGVPGSTDGTNGDARFSWPAAVAVDAAGNVYVADELNNTIRKITITGTESVVTTIAGTAGVMGNDDGTNAAAHFRYPRGIAVGRDENLYIADSFNGTIRKMAAAGTNWIVTTLAGGAYTGPYDGTNANARFYTPTDLVVDDLTNIFVADYGGGAIRRVTPIGGDWVVTTVARLSGAQGIARDKDGTLWIAGSWDHTIRTLVPQGTNWILTTVAGSAGVPGAADGSAAGAGFRMPEGIAVDSARNLYIADTGNDTIRFAQPIPSLEIIRVDGGAVLSWTTGASNFVLESSPSLISQMSWLPVTNGVVATPSGFVFTNQGSSQPIFYRLKQ